jgi:RNA methyltransferase, TrmH family
MIKFVPETNCSRDFFMLSRTQIKHIQSLKQKKFREIHRQFLAEGSKLSLEIIESHLPVTGVYALSGWLEQNATVLAKKNIPYTEVSESEMERITALASPSPALVIAGIPAVEIPVVTDIHDLVLVLDDIRDPGNLGTILRIADWFGIGSIVCSENTVDLYNPKVIQATMGSVARVHVMYGNLLEFLTSLDPGRNIYGTFPEGENIYSADLQPDGIIVIGSEALGISPGIVSRVTHRISIPSVAKGRGPGHAESLNASAATAIVCSEFRRRIT